MILLTSACDVSEKSFLVPRMLGRETVPRLSQFLRFLHAPSVYISACVTGVEVSGLPMDSSKDYNLICFVVVKHGVVCHCRWLHTDEELVQASPHPCRVLLLCVQYPHVIKSSVLHVSAKHDNCCVVGSGIASNHSSTASRFWFGALAINRPHLQPLINSCIILPCVLEVIFRRII